MKTDISFDVDFNYTLSENVTVELTAQVLFQHDTLFYTISNFHFKDHPGGNPLLNDINIMAVKKEKGINWVHIDSKKETVLSLAIGKAIEERGMVEFSDAEN